MTKKQVMQLAERIYLSKLCGFWANPDSKCALEEPSFTQCVEDASFALSAMERERKSYQGEEQWSQEAHGHVFDLKNRAG
jgi:hypothetical protein